MNADTSAVKSATAEYPPQGAPDGAWCPVDAVDGRWWLVHTRPRNEKALAADLDALRIVYYLPVARVLRRYGGRSVELRIPLFPGYLFLCGGVSERYATLSTHRAANVIHVVDQEQLKGDLRQIFRATTGDEPLNVYPGIKRGRRVRVRSGPLRGLEGVVLRRRDVCRVYVAVNVLGQSAELEIDAALLEVIE